MMKTYGIPYVAASSLFSTCVPSYTFGWSPRTGSPANHIKTSLSTLPVTPTSRKGMHTLAFSGPAFHFYPFSKRYSSTTQATDGTTNRPNINSAKRIAIIGGGIAGVSVAHALSQKVSNPITVYEGDPAFCTHIEDKQMPQWIAATARNANSLVPGASMHVFSCPSAVFQVLTDTFRETIYDKIRNTNDFSRPPPYFALHLGRCLGWSATHEERMCFLRFLWHFLSVSFLGSTDERAATITQLAKANREIYLQCIANNASLRQELGHSQGFLSIYRGKEKALKAMKEAQEFGEEATLLNWEKCVQMEPHLANLPSTTEMYAVLRENDYTASCAGFVRHWMKESLKAGVEYKQCAVKAVRRIEKNSDNHRFLIEGDPQENAYDIVILAAGPHTPLLATNMGAGKYCPTYPLRGYSLSLFTDASTKNPRSNKNRTTKPFSIDAMYCSSVSPTMIRMAGFGEFVGFRDKAVDVPSHAPTILTKYAEALFPDQVPVNSLQALQCFRAISADDVPLVGEVKDIPGLYLHTGHGTLGWTLGLATGECLAQIVAERIDNHGRKEEAFNLPGDFSISRKALSPNRFVH